MKLLTALASWLRRTLLERPLEPAPDHAMDQSLTYMVKGLFPVTSGSRKEAPVPERYS